MLSISENIPSVRVTKKSKSKKSKKVTKKASSLKNEPTRFPRPIKRFPRDESLTPPEYRIIVKKELDEETFKSWISTPHGWISGLTCDMEGNPSKLYDFQSEGMIDPSIFRAVNKARQTGFSYGESLKALAKSHLKKVQTSIFISINQEEANEKIRFARSAYHSMPTEYQRKIIVENKQSLEFEYKNSRTRILSFAQRQPRGKGNNTDLLLDEFAHMMWATSIYIASVPVITRGSGTLTIGSTPLGKDTLHYEILTNKEKYWRYSRLEIAWWDCPELCNNVEEARKLAPFMQTEERIKIFAKDKLLMNFDNMELEDFQQEYELYCADTKLSYYPLDLIKGCAFEDDKSNELEDNIDPDEIKVGWTPIKENGETIVTDTIMQYYKKENINWYYEGGSFHDEVTVAQAVKDMIERFLLNMEIGKFGRHLLFGMDVGRDRNSSEISIFEEYELEQWNLHIERMSVELIGIPFRIQKEIVKFFLKLLPIQKANIDGTKGSHGEDIAETLVFEYPQIVESISFDTEIKAKMAKNFKFRLEDRTIALYNDPHSIKQIHSIKKTVTESHIKFGADKTKKHHGDKFWSKALASLGGNEYDRDNIPSSSIIRMGTDRLFTPKDLQNNNAAIRIAGKSVLQNLKTPNISTQSPFDSLGSMFFDPTLHKF